MTTVSIRMEEEMKQQLEILCGEMGMNISTFFMIYVKKALRDRRIPFEIEAPIDPFYSESNMEQIAEAMLQVQRGEVVVMTMEDLEAIENE